jgi:hypothetical protein
MKLNLAHILIIVCILNHPVKSDIFRDISGWFGGIVDAAAAPLIDDLKQAVRESMDYLFDEKISKMIYQIEATSNRIMDHATEDINKIVDNFKAQMEDLVKNAIKSAEDMADHTIE